MSNIQYGKWVGRVPPIDKKRKNAMKQSEKSCAMWEFKKKVRYSVTNLSD